VLTCNLVLVLSYSLLPLALLTSSGRLADWGLLGYVCVSGGKLFLSMAGEPSFYT
jgi:hypothetical protein